VVYMNNNDNETVVFSKVMGEQNQGHETRQNLFYRIEKVLDRPVISFFTSFKFPVMIEDTDADMIEGLLQKMDLSKGLVLIINSPGGSGLAAERIINVCRNYSGTGEYWAIVPNKAKSAATMICFGASKIYMGVTSELGPVDPQMHIHNSSIGIISANILVESYKDLFNRAVQEDGNLEPYLQQLANYDEREIKVYESAIELSTDIAIRTLTSGMLKELSEEKEDVIKEKLNMFLEPRVKKIHGRPIYRDEAETSGIKIDRMETSGKLWDLVFELYIRTNNYVTTKVAKCIESKEHSFAARISDKEEE